MPLSPCLARATQRYALVQRDIIVNNGGLADDHPRTMIDDDPLPQLGSRMDLDTRDKANHLGHRSSCIGLFLLPKHVGDAMTKYRTNPWVKSQHLKC
jgi:hypothetical protein